MTDRGCPTCQVYRKLAMFRVVSKPGEKVRYAKRCVICDERKKQAKARRAA